MKYFLTVYKVYAHITAQKIKTSPFFGSFVPACQANEGSWLNHRGNWQFPWQVDLPMFFEIPHLARDFLHTVDGRNPKQPPGMVLKPG